MRTNSVQLTITRSWIGQKNKPVVKHESVNPLRITEYHNPMLDYVSAAKCTNARVIHSWCSVANFPLNQLHMHSDILYKRESGVLLYLNKSRKETPRTLKSKLTYNDTHVSHPAVTQTCIVCHENNLSLFFEFCVTLLVVQYTTHHEDYSY